MGRDLPEEVAVQLISQEKNMSEGSEEQSS